jgi:hypothetical protein
VTYFKDYPGIAWRVKKLKESFWTKKKKLEMRPAKQDTHKIFIAIAVILVILDTCMGDVCYMV